MWALGVIGTYLLGTFPSAVIVARAHGVDITTFGSGNPGASNVTRALGWRAGVLVFVLDAAKGAVAAGAGLALDVWSIDGRGAGYLFGAAAVLGHVFPATRRFRGGKGVATGGGVLLVMWPIVGVAVVALWWVVSKVTRTAALASIAAVLAAAVGLVVSGAPAWEIAATGGLCVLILSRHLGNLRRLVRREEPELRGTAGTSPRERS